MAWQAESACSDGEDVVDAQEALCARIFDFCITLVGLRYWQYALRALVPPYYFSALLKNDDGGRPQRLRDMEMQWRAVLSGELRA